MNNLSTQMLDIVDDVYSVTESTLRHFYFASHEESEISQTIDALALNNKIHLSKGCLGRVIVSNK